MNILVIDDSPVHREAAMEQLSGHATVIARSYDEGRAIICGEEDFREGFFDVVLVDLLMPPSMRKQAEFKEYGEMPLGTFLALLAAKKGAKFVAVFTDSDHHDHPASACFDDFNPDGESRPSVFNVEGAKMILCNTRIWGIYTGKKRWDRVLNYLLENA